MRYLRLELWMSDMSIALPLTVAVQRGCYPKDLCCYYNFLRSSMVDDVLLWTRAPEKHGFVAMFISGKWIEKLKLKKKNWNWMQQKQSKNTIIHTYIPTWRSKMRTAATGFPASEAQRVACTHRPCHDVPVVNVIRWYSEPDAGQPEELHQRVQLAEDREALGCAKGY